MSAIVTTASLSLVLVGCGAGNGVDDGSTAPEDETGATELCASAEEVVKIQREVWGENLPLDASPNEVRDLTAALDEGAAAVGTLRGHVDEAYHPLLQNWHRLFVELADAYMEIDYDVSRLADGGDAEAWAAFAGAWQALEAFPSEDPNELADEFSQELEERCGLRPAQPVGPPDQPGGDEATRDANPEFEFAGALARVVEQYVELARNEELADRACPLWDDEVLEDRLSPYFDAYRITPSPSVGWSVTPNSAAFICGATLMTPDRSEHVGRAVRVIAEMPTSGHEPGGEIFDVATHGQVVYHDSESDGTEHTLTAVDETRRIQLTIVSAAEEARREILVETLQVILEHAH